MMTKVVDEMVTTLVTLDGTSVDGIKTGDGGIGVDDGITIVCKIDDETAEWVGIETISVEATFDGTVLDEIMTKVVPGMVTTLVSDDGTTEAGTITGDDGNEETDGIGRVSTTVPGIVEWVGTVTITSDGTVFETLDKSTITKVVPGIVITETVEATSDYGTITGDDGNELTGGNGSVLTTVSGTILVVGTETTSLDPTVVGTFDDEMMTKVVDEIVTTSVTEVGTSVTGITTGEFGKMNVGGIETL
jgi:hypothetical protein